MEEITKKQALLQSIEGMNSAEMDQVINYVKKLLYNESNDWDYLRFKKEALKEIQSALQQHPA